MTITETPVLDYLRLEVERPVPGVYRLDASVLGGPDLLGAGTGTQWDDILPLVTGEVACRRGGRAEPANPAIEVGTLTATLLDAPQDAVRPGQAVRLMATYGELFTGRITGVTVTEARDGFGVWHTYTTLTAVDAVAELANITRYGALVERGQAVETFTERLNRILQSAPSSLVRDATPLTTMPTPTVTRALYLPHPTAPSDENTRWHVPGGSATFDMFGRLVLTVPAGGYAERTLTDLVPGRLYSVYADLVDAGDVLAYGVDTSRPTFTPPGYDGPLPVPAAPRNGLTFIAQGTTARLRFNGPASPLLRRLDVYEWALPWYALASTVHETSLASYLDQTCASYPGARWWVDAMNRLRLAIDPILPVIAFTDEPDPDALHYVDVTRGRSTGDVVTEIAMTAHQRSYDDNGTAVALDRPYTHRDETAAATWGGQSLALETYTATDRDAQAIANRVLTALGSPAMRVTGLTWNAQEDPDRLADLDVTGEVTVTRSGDTSALRIAAITHQITHTRHMVTLDLIPQEA